MENGEKDLCPLCARVEQLKTIISKGQFWETTGTGTFSKAEGGRGRWG